MNFSSFFGVVTLLYYLKLISDTTETVEEKGCTVKTISLERVICPDAKAAILEGYLDDDHDVSNDTCNKTDPVGVTLSCYDGYLERLYRTSLLKFQSGNSPCPPEEPDKSEILPWQLELYKILQPIIIIPGIVGNVLSFVVMSSKYMRNFSFSIYLKSLAVLDSIILVHYGIKWGSTMHLIEQPKGYVYCMTYPFFVRVCQLSSAWLVAAFSVDRSIAVCFPFLRTRYVTPFRTRLIVAMLILVAFLSQLYHPILLDKKITYCQAFSFPASVKNIGTMEILVVFSRFGLLFVLPFAVILLSNVSVVVALSRRLKHTISNSESSNSSTSTNNSNNKDKERRVSLRLFSVSIAYLLLFLPETALMIQDLNNIINGVDKWFDRGRDFRSTCGLIFSLNFAINYILYGLVFRKHVVICTKCNGKCSLSSEK